jgi:putative sugar O-methyltransferase
MRKRTSISDDTKYPELCLRASEDDSVFENFKNNSDYEPILEHVHESLGQSYYNCVEIKYPNMLKFLNSCSKNDEIGNPVKITYSFGSFSPTTLRYLKVASDLSDLFDGVENMNVLEIGGGYGGQCLVSSMTHGFKSWTIVDLPEVSKLQKKYLEKNKIDNVNFLSHDIVPTEKYDLIISNYAFSECTKSMQDFYLENYFNEDAKIYMTLNFIESEDEDLNSSYDAFTLKNILKTGYYREVPQTHPKNIIALRGNDCDLK